MSNKSQNQSKPAAAPAPTPAAPAPAPASQAAASAPAPAPTNSLDEGVGAGPDTSSEPVVDAGASKEATAEQVTGGSGAMVASTTDKVGTKTSVADVVAKKEEQAAAASAGPWSSEAQGYIDGLQTASAKNGFAELATYLDEMAPGKPVDPIRMANNQVSLWRTIQLLLNQSGNEFPVVFGVLLKIFHEHANGALGGTYVFRGAENIAMRNDDQVAFRQVLNMLVHMADPKSREQKGKAIDFSRTLSFGLTDQARTSILTFFNK